MLAERPPPSAPASCRLWAPLPFERFCERTRAIGEGGAMLEPLGEERGPREEKAQVVEKTFGEMEPFEGDVIVQFSIFST